MTVNRTHILLAATVIAIGSTGCSQDRDHDLAVGSARALGVSTIHVAETAGTLHIEGRDDAGRRVANVELEVGTVQLTFDEPRLVEGRLLSIAVGATQTQHESEGLATLELPSPRDARIARFVEEPAVAAALGRWGVTIDQAAIDPSVLSLDEDAYSCGTAYGGSGCESSPHAGCTTTSKRRWPLSGEYGEFRCCWSESRAAERRCKASTGSGQSTACGTTGANGCAVCWLEIADESCVISWPAGSCRMDWC